MHLTSREKVLDLQQFMCQLLMTSRVHFPISSLLTFSIHNRNVNGKYERTATDIMPKPFTVENDLEKFTACWLAEAAYDKGTKEMRFRLPLV